MRIRFNAGRLNRVYEVIPTIIVVNDAVDGVAVELHWMGMAAGVLFVKNGSGHE